VEKLTARDKTSTWTLLIQWSRQ